MRKYAYTAIGHVFLITVLAAQWYARSRLLFLLFSANARSD